MHEIESVAASFTTIHSGRPWHGPSLKLILSEVTPAMAAAKVEGAHSIWELMLHMRGWMQVVLLRLDGQSVGEPPEGDFPQIPEPLNSNWKAAIRQYESTQRKLQARLKVIPSRAWNRPIPGKPYTIATMVNGLLWHNLYHAGQIAVRKRILQVRQ